ncbi:MAG: UDP-3-O-(3-hydroxymyristoyl)glucosamine N-acyltransferase [Planctomycetales bacterium]|nr:UDP-3-O-(3-hydroxymyristoyl)glucosamine N-acyltransferase [Planctomycetales bacterium]
MSTTLADLAELVQGRLQGDPTTKISGAATLEVAEAGQITLADHTVRAQRLANSPAAAAIISADVVCQDRPTIVVDQVHEAFKLVVAHFRPARLRPQRAISSQAVVSPSAQLGEDVSIHPLATIGDDVTIGSGSTIHSGARIMAGCTIGSNVEVFPNAVLYEDTRVGDRSIIHAGAVLGAYGFGYRKNSEGKHELSAQLGYVELGCDVEIGACTTVDRGTYGPTVIDDGTKIDDLVQVAHNCRLGKHNLICGQVGIAGSTTTGDYVVMAGQVGVRDHVHIGTGAVLCSKAGIPNDVAEGEVMLGQPATPLRRQKVQMAAIAKLPEMRRQLRAMQRLLEELQEKSEENPGQHPGEKAA